MINELKTIIKKIIANILKLAKVFKNIIIRNRI
jgi:hypothetical protein